MSSHNRVLGIVENGQFKPLAPTSQTGDKVRLTSLPAQAAQPPDSAELNLAEYEGGAIMVQGHHSGGWIYAAEVIDRAGPILTAVVQHVFGHREYSY